MQYSNLAISDADDVMNLLAISEHVSWKVSTYAI